MVSGDLPNGRKIRENQQQKYRPDTNTKVEILKKNLLSFSVLIKNLQTKTLIIFPQMLLDLLSFPSIVLFQISSIFGLLFQIKEESGGRTGLQGHAVFWYFYLSGHIKQLDSLFFF